jgi:hypothetical protein
VAAKFYGQTLGLRTSQANDLAVAVVPQRA